MAHSIDVLIAFVQGLRASRGGHQNAAAARKRLEALQAAQTAVKAAGEGLAWLLLGELVDEQQALVEKLEAKEVEHQAAERRRLLASVCALENHAADADGGWTDYGVSEWLANVEAWAAERAR